MSRAEIKETIKMVAFFIVICFFSILMTCGEEPRKPADYPKVAKVIDIDYDNNVMTLMDCVGNCWEWEDIEDYEIGDLCGMIMNDNATDQIYDDIIVQIRYCGKAEWFAQKISWTD